LTEIADKLNEDPGTFALISDLTVYFAKNGSSPILVVFHDKSGCYSLRNNESYQTDFLTN
jgi:hypothetical protein